MNTALKSLNSLIFNVEKERKKESYKVHTDEKEEKNNNKKYTIEEKVKIRKRRRLSEQQYKALPDYQQE